MCEKTNCQSYSKCHLLCCATLPLHGLALIKGHTVCCAFCFVL